MRTFRNPALHWVLPVTGLELAVVAWAARSVLAAVLIMSTWLIVAGLAYRVRVEADAQHVRVVNVLRTTVVPWSEVAAVETDDANGRCVVRLRSGAVLNAWGLYAGSAGLGSVGIAKAVYELATLNARYRGPRARHPAAEVAARGALARMRSARGASGPVLGALVAGLGALGGGAYLLTEYATFAEHGVRVEAVVTEVSDGFKYTDVTLRYVVDGQTMVARAGDWRDRPDVGQTVTAVYDATNPADIIDARDAGTRSAFLEVVGVLVIGASALTYAVVVGLRGPWS